MLKVICKLLLVFHFDFDKLVERGVIISKLFKLLKLFQILFPAVTNAGCNKVAQAWVGVQKPAALCNTVCLIVKLLRINCIPVFKLCSFKKFCMKGCNTVYAKAGMNCHPGHVNHVVVNDCHVFVLVVVVRELLAQFNYKTSVDFFYNLVNTWKQSLENRDWPFFQSFCKNCMVCISKGMSYNVPGIIPANIVIIQEDTHKFRNCNYRVSIIKLNYMIVCKMAEVCSVVCNIVAYQILERCRREEVLLLKTKGLSAWTIVVRIQNAADIFCTVLAFYGAVVFHVVKKLKIKAVWRRSLPETQCVYSFCTVTDDRHIIRSSCNLLCIFYIKAWLTVWSFSVADVSAKLYGNSKVRTFDFPRVAVGKPVIRIFNLVAVFYALFKHTIFVADSIAVSRIIQSCKRIEEAGSKTTKTTVSKTCIRLFVFDHIKVNVHFIKNFFYRVFDSCIYKVIAKSTSHKKLCRQVVKLLYRFFVVFCTGCHPVWHNNFYCTCRNCIKKVMLVCLRNIFSILTAQTSRKIFFELFFVEFH